MKRLFTFVTLTLVAALTLAGCGGNDDTTSSSAYSSSSSNSSNFNDADVTSRSR